MVERYGEKWPVGTPQLKIEFWMLHQANDFIKSKGSTRLNIYLEIHRLLWPEDIQHRWFVQGMKCIVENDITVLMGCSDAGKSYLMYCHALIDFFAFPHNSLSMISSTDARSLEIRIWGMCKEYFNRAKNKFEWLDGFVLDAKMAITADELDDDSERGRTLNRGIICIPCVSGGQYVGLGKFIGVKPPNSPGKMDGLLKHYGDEVQVMRNSFLDAYSNWYGKPNFKGVMAGNPIDISDCLCVAGEPVEGWDKFEDTGVTQEWPSRFYGAHVLAYDGRDTPNNDQTGIKFPFLISKKKLDAVALTEGGDSWKWFSQCIGKPSKNMISWRVITIGLCERHKAFEDVVWKGTPLTKLIAIDPAYGGGDRCVSLELGFGTDLDGKTVLSVGDPEIVPIKLNYHLEAEAQIAEHTRHKSERLNIPPGNIFYDSFGRGTLGAAFAKVFGFNCPIPVDSGAKCSGRPVRHDLFIQEMKNGRIEKRLKRCDEHYSKFVTEMWFSVREVIESDQMRNLKRAVAEEGQLRMYKIVTGNRIEVESKDDMKERIKKSPDLMDTLAVGVEGARRKGFQILRIGQEIEEKSVNRDWMDKVRSKVSTLNRKHQLTHS